jgi:Protein kinase domain
MTTYPCSLRGGLSMKATASSRSKARKQNQKHQKETESSLIPSPIGFPNNIGFPTSTPLPHPVGFPTPVAFAIPHRVGFTRATERKSPLPRATTAWVDPDLLIASPSTFQQKQQKQQEQNRGSPLLKQVSPMPRTRNVGQFTPTLPHTHHNPSFVFESPLAHRQQTELARRLFANGFSPAQLQFTQETDENNKTMIFKENEKEQDHDYKRALSASKKFTLQNGQIIPYNSDNFIFHRKLGYGSFGQVWLVSPKDQPNKELVLKKLFKKKDGTSNSTSLPALMRELVALRHLRAVCQNYLVCYDGFFEDDSHFYITTNYIAGMKELRQVIESHRIGQFKLSDDILKIIINNLVEGLALIHKHDVAHRDIKPANILVNPNNGQIRYVDFGLACWSEECLGDKHIKGTLSYIAPDIYPASARRIGFTLKQLQAGDIWALGATIWELLDGESIAQVWTRSVRELSQYLGCRGFELLKFPENFRYVDFPMGEFSWKSIMVEKELAHLPGLGPKIKTLKTFLDLDWIKRIAAFDYLVSH